jgi:uncharacterized protein YbjT (DUF2867 family)
MILVTGASGTVGREVLSELSKTGRPVLAMYRSAEDARSAPAGVNTAIADFADQTALHKALRGVDTIFLVCSPVPELVELEGNVLEACGAAGVRHVVLNSALGAGDYDKSFPSWHRKVEDKLKASDLGYTILRPNTFMQNMVTYYSESIRTQGAFYSSMGDARISFIDVRDIGTATANILVAPAAHAAQIYELNGPEAFSFADVAAMISKLVGKPVQFVNIPVEAEGKAMLDLGMPEWQVNALLDLHRYYTIEKKGAHITPVLEKILGRPAIRMQQYLADNKEAFRRQAAGA